MDLDQDLTRPRPRGRNPLELHFRKAFFDGFAKALCDKRTHMPRNPVRNTHAPSLRRSALDPTRYRVSFQIPYGSKQSNRISILPYLPEGGYYLSRLIAAGEWARLDLREGMTMGKLCEPLDDIQNCSLQIILKLMGERWSFMILHARYNRVHQFK